MNDAPKPSEFDADLAKAFDDEIKKAQPTAPRKITTMIEAEESIRRTNRDLIVRYRKNVATAKQRTKHAVENLEGEKKRKREAHLAEMKMLDERIAEVKEYGAAEVKAGERIIAASRTAIGELAAE